MSTNKKILSDPSSVTARPMRLKVDTTPEDVRVDVVPLIDVVFCILIFFILAAVSFSRQQAISIDLPKASTGKPQGRQILVVSLNELGQVYVEQQPVMTKEQLLQKLQDYHQKNPDGLMALYAAANASYNQVVQVLDLLRQVGGDRVALATLPGESNLAPNSNPAGPPTTGVPSYMPSPGASPYDPLNPALTPLPGSPGQPLPGSPGGINPGSPPPLPGQSGVSPGTAVPIPGTTTSPRTNTAPGSSAVPIPGTTTSPRTNTAPGSSAVPSPGVQASPKTNTAPGSSVAPSPGAQTSPRTNTAP
jgi:biopolymer transport protein ExbD